MDSEPARLALEEAVRRVGSIAIVHEMLSQAVEERVPFDDIIDPLSRMVTEVSAVGNRVRVRREGSFGVLPSETATGLAMVLTELLQNAVEHGYPDGWASTAPGRVLVTMTNDGVELVVRVHDDGVGLPEGFDVGAPSLGLTIVRTLVTTELGGSLSMSTDGGTLVELRVPVAAGAAP
jgi:two-component sensor histidine kinase